MRPHTYKAHASSFCHGATRQWLAIMTTPGTTRLHRQHRAGMDFRTERRKWNARIAITGAVQRPEGRKLSKVAKILMRMLRYFATVCDNKANSTSSISQFVP